MSKRQLRFYQNYIFFFFSKDENDIRLKFRNELFFFFFIIIIIFAYIKQILRKCGSLFIQCIQI